MKDATTKAHTQVVWWGARPDQWGFRFWREEGSFRIMWRWRLLLGIVELRRWCSDAESLWQHERLQAVYRARWEKL